MARCVRDFDSMAQRREEGWVVGMNDACEGGVKGEQQGKGEQMKTDQPIDGVPADWFSDDIGLSMFDIDELKKRIGARVWDNLIHVGGMSTGVWRPMPYNDNNPVVQVLRLYKSRKEFRSDNAS